MKKGLTLLEVVLSFAILSILVVSVYPVIGWLITRSKQLQYGSEAAMVLQQGAEATYNIFLDNWNAFGNGRYRYAVTVADPADPNSPPAWTLVSLAAGEVDEVGRFGRVIRVFSACRLTNGTGQNAGKLQEPPEADPGCNVNFAPDPNSKVIITSVDWAENTVTKHIEARLLVTKL